MHLFDGGEWPGAEAWLVDGARGVVNAKCLEQIGYSELEAAQLAIIASKIIDSSPREGDNFMVELFRAQNQSFYDI